MSNEQSTTYEAPSIVEEGVLEIRAGSLAGGSSPGFPDDPLGLPPLDGI